MKPKEPDIYDDFKLEKPFGLHGFIQKYLSVVRVMYTEYRVTHTMHL